MINNAARRFLATDLGYILLLAAAIGDLSVPFFLAPFSGKYNHLTMVMSLLGNRNHNYYFIYNFWLISAGVMFVIGSIKLFADFSQKSFVITVYLVFIILVYAVGACILSGIFSAGETKEMLTIQEKIHGYASASGFLLLAFAPLLIALLSFQTKEIMIGVISMIFFVFAVLFFALFVMADKEYFAHTIISYEGLWQRLSMFCMYAPIIILSLKKVITKC